jgi:hypothetical protein
MDNLRQATNVGLIFFFDLPLWLEELFFEPSVPFCCAAAMPATPASNTISRSLGTSLNKSQP